MLIRKSESQTAVATQLTFVHQESVLIPLLFIIVMEALSCEFRTGWP